MGLLDRLFNRTQRRQSVRRFDAAGGGRRGSGFGLFGRTQMEISGAAVTVRSRARYLAANNSYVANGVANWVGSLIGAGIVPTGDAEAVALFMEWADVADADGRTDFFGLQAEAARSLVIDGEAFIRVLATEDGLRLQLIPAELVDESRTAELADGGYIVGGVEFNASGERVAYHVTPAKPSDVFATYSAPVRVPATEILHIFKPLGIGQTRGISWLAPIVVPANELDAIVDGLAVGVKVAALHAGFLTDMNGTAGELFDGDDISLEPGTLRRLPTGVDIKFSSPQQANEVASFLRFNLQMLAAGLGLPEHMLSGNLSDANYSSLRAGLLPFRQRVEQLQYHVLTPQLLNPVWRRVMTLATLTGDMDTLPKAEWLPPAWQQVDPKKAVEADVAELAAGLTSRRKLVAARGWSIADLDQEIASDHAREKTLGLTFTTEESNGKDATQES